MSCIDISVIDFSECSQRNGRVKSYVRIRMVFSRNTLFEPGCSLYGGSMLAAKQPLQVRQSLVYSRFSLSFFSNILVVLLESGTSEHSPLASGTRFVKRKHIEGSKNCILL